jgi:N-acetylmuramoyl-L-alanine amidase
MRHLLKVNPACRLPAVTRSSQPTRPAQGFSFFAAIGEALRQIGVVLVVGMALATVYTAWSAPTLIPDNVAQQIAGALATRQVGVQVTPLPSVATTAPTLPRIGIVAGHNGPGNDPGAVCPDGLTEAAVNHDIATRVQVGLEANGFGVDLLDEFDPRLEGYQALAVVSVHNDSCAFVNDQATGFKVAGALDTGAPQKAERLVNCLTDSYAKQTSLPYHPGSVTADMTSYHTFYEVNATTPIAIIETGFLNLDRKILTEEPQRVAQGVIDGILCYVLALPEGTATPAP